MYVYTDIYLKCCIICQEPMHMSPMTKRRENLKETAVNVHNTMISKRIKCVVGGSDESD